MSIIKLIGLGLWVSPFVFMPSGTRGPKEIFVLAVCLALGLLAVYRGEVKKFTNKWALFLMGWFMVNLIMAPKFEVSLLGSDASNFWIWKPFLICVAYFLAVMAISSAKVTSRDWTKILKALIYPAFIMAVYLIFQYFGYDQIFGVRQAAIDSGLPSARMAGTMGNPTIVSPFVAMCIPFAIYGRKYLIALTMTVAVILTQSMVAIGALVLTLLLFISLFRNAKFLLVGMVALGIFIAVMVVPETRNMVIKKVDAEDNGRLTTWFRIIEDGNNPVLGGRKTYPFTGLGAGAFKYVYSPRMMPNSPKWRQAHNEYIEILYNFGIGGAFLFFMAIFYFLKRSIPFALDYGGGRVLTILSSLFCISICAGGTFVWQIGTMAFYTVVLVGLLHNKDFLKGVKHE